jgi:hypothetical protein
MVHSPSKRWENGVLVERAISTNAAGEPREDEEGPQATKPYKTPLVTPRSPEDHEQYQRDRGKADKKAVQSAENKSVRSAKKK